MNFCFKILKCIFYTRRKLTCPILLILVHTGNLYCLAIFYKLAANEQRLLPKTSKISINTPK